MTGMPRAEIGVIGGSGFYEFLEGAKRVHVDTPFGDPSDDLVVGELRGRRVAFVARHGKGHRFQPHLVPYRANLWALRSLGVRQVIAPCAVGSLRRELGPGTVVVVDQVVDRTWGRPHSVYDQLGAVVHVGFAEPFCPRGRPVVVAAAQQAGLAVAAIARELALCFTTVALVTDLDAGVEGESGVTHEEVLQVFAENIEGLKGVLTDAVEALPPAEPDETASCGCRRALDGLTLPFALPT